MADLSTLVDYELLEGKSWLILLLYAQCFSQVPVGNTVIVQWLESV